MLLLPFAVTVLALAPSGAGAGDGVDASGDDVAAARAPAEAPVAADAKAPDKVARWKLLVLDVNSADLDKPQAQTLTQFIAARAGRFPSLDVVSQADLRDLVALDADKREAGCDADNNSCLAEVAGALGAELVLSTHAGKLDGVFLVTLQLFDARVSSAEGRASVQAWSLQELPQKIGPALDDILRKATGEEPVESAANGAVADRPGFALSPGVQSALEIGGGVGAGVGALAVVLGATPGFLYASKKGELADLTRAFTGNADDLKKAAKVHQDALDDKDLYNNVGRWGVAGGAVLVLAGGGALAAALLLPVTTTSSSEGGAE